MATLQRALEIAVSAHSGVIDKSGCLYIFHPIRLVLKAETEEEKILAALHDVVEDCEDWTFERCCGSVISIRVKLLDIADNMDITRLPAMEEKDLGRMKRYHKARLRLMEALVEWQKRDCD